MCSMLAKFKFNLDLSRGSDLQETPTVVAGGVYKLNQNDAYTGSSVSTTKYKPINLAKVQLPPPLPSGPPPLPTTTPPNLDKEADFEILPNPIPGVPVHDSNVSENPKGETVKRLKSTDIREERKKPSKKQQKELQKLERERVRDQKQKDKILIAQIIKEDSERTAREAKLLKERKKDKSKGKKTEKPNTETKDAKPAKPEEKTNKPEPKVQTANPLAQVRPQSNMSGPPPPYSLEIPRPNVTVNDTDGSGNTSYGKPMEGTGTWELISQHQQQINRPKVKTSVKTEGSRYIVGNMPPPGKDEEGLPGKSLHV